MMLFLTAVCGQDYQKAKEMDSRDAMGLQSAFGRFLKTIFKTTKSKGSGSNFLEGIPHPSEWIK